MKKNKLWLTSLMVVMGISCLSIAACSDNETSKNGVSENANQVVLADFEEWAPDFQLLRLREEFGAIEVNKDADFVKSGEQSAKLYVMGSERSNDPYFFIQTQSDLFGYDYSDFSKVESVSAWMYNPSTEETEISVGLVTEIEDIFTASLAKPYSVTLKQGWNEIVYEPDMNYVISSVGVDNYEGIKGLYFMFDKSGATTKAEAPQYYIDDVTIQYGEKREFVPVKAGAYYAAGSVVGGKAGLFLKNPIDMNKLVDKALHFEFKFDTDEGSFGFAVLASDWANVTGTLVITKEDGEVTANFGRIVVLEDGWYAWELNYDMFGGDGMHRASDVGLIYYAGQIVEGNVEINWLTLSIVEPHIYTRDELATKYETGEQIGGAQGQSLGASKVPMEELQGKALQFEFKFETDGRFGFAILASDWANVAGILVVEKSGDEITANFGRIMAIEDGWYTWTLNKSEFAGDGAYRATDVGLLYHQNPVVSGTVWINLASWKAVDAYEIPREQSASKYTDGQKICNIVTGAEYYLAEPIYMTDLEGKALHFEFKFESETGSFVVALCDSQRDWANLVGTLEITKTADGITSNIGRVIEVEDGWYAWELNRSLFEGDGVSKAEKFNMIYHQNQVVSGTVYIDWTSWKAVDAY